MLQTLFQNIAAVIALMVAFTLCIAILISLAASALGHPLDANAQQIVSVGLPVLLACLGGAGAGGVTVAYRSARANEMLAQTLSTLNAEKK